MDAVSGCYENASQGGKVHGDMRSKLSSLVHKILEIFPFLEAVQPRKSGMQALCDLHWALDKAKLLLQHCTNSSKLYLAMTGDSVLVKFEKVKDSLGQSLRRLGLAVPQDLAEQISVLVSELEQTVFEWNPLDKEVGDEIISLLQRETDREEVNTFSESDMFEQVALKLGLKSCKAVLAEKAALKHLADKSRSEDDRKKELIVSYLLHLLRRYSKIQKLELIEDVAVGGGICSSPSSPSERGGMESDGHSSDLGASDSNAKQMMSYYYCRAGGGFRCSGHVVIPPEEFRCPISLQLMSDPVIISSGQTYERVCIEKWFEEGHDTCPKTQQKLSHLEATPNYCVKSLIASWCERHGVAIPEAPSPPPSPPFKDQISDTFLCLDTARKGNERRPENAIAAMMKSYCSDKELQCSGTVNEIQAFSSSSCVGEKGIVQVLVDFLRNATNAQDRDTQRASALALLDVAANNDRKKAEVVASGTVPLLLSFFDVGIALATKEAAVVLLLAVSSLEENKPSICLSGVVPFLVGHLKNGSDQGSNDALTTLLNLSSAAQTNHRVCLIKAGIVPKLVHLVSLGDADVTEKCLGIFHNLASIEEGRLAIAKTEYCISTIADMLDTGTPNGRDHAVATFLLLCTNSNGTSCSSSSSSVSSVNSNNNSNSTSDYSQLVLREGIIPSLVTLSVNGNPSGREKAQKLLLHFRELRQKDCLWQPPLPENEESSAQVCSRPILCQSWNPLKSRRSSGMPFVFFRRSRSLSFYRC